MASPSVDDGPELERSRSQSGMQIWLACALFVGIPVVVILVVKYLFGI